MNPKELTFDLDHKQFVLTVSEQGTLSLFVDNCLRKQDSIRENIRTAYVWTNIELHWEEHRFVEARYFGEQSRLHVTVNGKTVHDEIVNFT